jgi:hypothetical protein
VQVADTFPPFVDVALDALSPVQMLFMLFLFSLF